MRATPPESTAPNLPDDEVEALARAAYERCHPEDSFEALRRRGRFSKQDRGLLRGWLAAAARSRMARSRDATLVAAE